MPRSARKRGLFAAPPLHGARILRRRPRRIAQAARPRSRCSTCCRHAAGLRGSGSRSRAGSCRSSVDRNRVKRIVREIFRMHPVKQAGLDCVVALRGQARRRRRRARDGPRGRAALRSRGGGRGRMIERLLAGLDSRLPVPAEPVVGRPVPLHADLLRVRDGGDRASWRGARLMARRAPQSRAATPGIGAVSIPSPENLHES